MNIFLTYPRSHTVWPLLRCVLYAKFYNVLRVEVIEAEWLAWAVNELIRPRLPISAKVGKRSNATGARESAHGYKRTNSISRASSALGLIAVIRGVDANGRSGSPSKVRDRAGNVGSWR